MIFTLIITLSITFLNCLTYNEASEKLETATFALLSAGKKFNAPILDDLENILLSQCVMECSRHKKCGSINYSNSLKMCQLLKDDEENGNFTSNASWAHYGPAKPIKEPKSCLDVQKKNVGANLTSGMYNVWMNGTEQSVYCEMDQGWLMILNVTLQNPTQYEKLETSTLNDFDKVYNQNWRFDISALRKLYAEIQFKQIRFYCRKDDPGRTVDIATNTAILGANVVDYMLGQSDVFPTSCGSYDQMPADTSHLGRVCYWWNRGTWSVGTGYISPSNRMYDSTFFRYGKLVYSVGTACDDLFGANTSGQWQIFVK